VPPIKVTDKVHKHQSESSSPAEAAAVFAAALLGAATPLPPEPEAAAEGDEATSAAAASASHASIRETDLAAGLFDEAAIAIGAVDWTTLDHHTLYTGQIGRIEDDQSQFAAELRSTKSLLEQDLVPRTSPTCRAEFCGRGCGLSAVRFTAVHPLAAVDLESNRVRFDGLIDDNFVDGWLRFMAGPQTGLTFGIVDAAGGWLALDRPLVPGTLTGTRTELREGCDHTIATCANRFGNGVNFRGEPFLPGNDLLARYGQP
jgi:uncharacterized phage protein (TIGR02218 family)